MQQVLAKYIPKAAVEGICILIQEWRVQLKIVNERKTRHGDYKMRGGYHIITVNANLNPYRFLITLVHELAHLVAFEKYGHHIKPHGKEWKHSFTSLMLPLLHPSIFPSDFLPVLARHFKNPTASSDTDTLLHIALKKYDEASNKSYIFEIPYGSYFKFRDHKIFRKEKKRIKRYECIEIKTGRVYVFQPHAQVELVKEN